MTFTLRAATRGSNRFDPDKDDRPDRKVESI